MRTGASVDVQARQLREALEWLVLGDDDRAIANAARALCIFCADHPEYVLCRLHPAIDPTPVEPEVKRIQSKYEGRCKGCKAVIVPGEEVLWTPGEKGVTCLKCGGKP
jgi:hypothetical protein